MVGTGHEIAEREGGGVVENEESGRRWAGAWLNVGQGLGQRQQAETKNVRTK